MEFLDYDKIIDNFNSMDNFDKRDFLEYFLENISISDYDSFDAIMNVYSNKYNKCKSAALESYNKGKMDDYLKRAVECEKYEKIVKFFEEI